MTPAVLVIDDEVQFARNIETYLTSSGFDAHKSYSGSRGLDKFAQVKPDVVLLDFKLPDFDGLEVLRRLQTLDPRVNVVMMTGVGGVDVAVEAMKAGARDYITKPVILKDLKALLEAAAGQVRSKGNARRGADQEAEHSGLRRLLGESPALVALKSNLRRIIEADRNLVGEAPASVLITGETGTGKELAARAIHFDGPRKNRAFVELNCAAIPAHLLESELFGYERGAFTDARNQKDGLVELADGGTLFLDEIGDMEPEIQAKLLRLIEDKVVRRLGGLRDRKIDVRIIAATNQPLEEQVRKRQFRADLYYRLRVLQVHVPPLRERKSDILLLAEHFLRDIGERYRKENVSVGPDVKKTLVNHSWPGNVRELRNVIEQAALLCQGATLDPETLYLFSDLGEGQTRVSAQDEPAAFKLPASGVDLAQVERNFVEQALRRTEGNVTKAAALLGLSRDTLRYRMEKFRLR